MKCEYFLKQPEAEISIVDSYRRYLRKYEKSMECYQIFFDFHNECNEFSNKLSINLRNSYNEIAMNLDNSVKKLMKLKQREMIIRRENLKLLIESAEDRGDEEREIEVNELIEMNSKFNEITESFDLSVQEIDEIDEEVQKKMNELEENYTRERLVKIDLKEFQKFYKYQSLLKEYEIANDELNSCKMRKRKSFNEVDNWTKMENDLTKIEEAIRVLDEKKALNEEKESSKEEEYTEQKAHLEKFRSFLQMEMIEELFENKKETMDLIEKYQRISFLNLMQLEYFPQCQRDNIDDFVFNDFIADFKLMKFRNRF
uniref:Uncharacterized protein n=1 Tax=Caenorhabditis tropicalis TaxID=1561998 RepID=A0A1I7TFW6_9PELO